MNVIFDIKQKSILLGRYLTYASTSNFFLRSEANKRETFANVKKRKFREYKRKIFAN